MAALTEADVATRLGEARERIARAGGDPAAVTVVAVTKGFGPDAVAAARAAGLTDIGENYLPELLDKHDGRPRWHFLGRVQRREVRKAAGVDVWQGVDRQAAAEEVAARWPASTVLVQVNTSGEPQKLGCTVRDAPPLVRCCAELGLEVRGLMTVGPHGGPEAARPGFRTLAALARDLGLPELSMGMTDDLEVAVEEGSTMVRLGRALFGPRPDHRRVRR